MPWSSGPKTSATRPRALAATISAAASRGGTARRCAKSSRGADDQRAVGDRVAERRHGRAPRARTSRACAATMRSPTAPTRVRGYTGASSPRPKFFITRAAEPTLPPRRGRTRTMRVVQHRPRSSRPRRPRLAAAPASGYDLRNGPPASTTSRSPCARSTAPSTFLALLPVRVNNATRPGYTDDFRWCDFYVGDVRKLELIEGTRPAASSSASSRSAARASTTCRSRSASSTRCSSAWSRPGCASSTASARR